MQRPFPPGTIEGPSEPGGQTNAEIVAAQKYDGFAGNVF